MPLKHTSFQFEGLKSMAIIYDTTTYIIIKGFTRKLLNQGFIVVTLKSPL